MLITKNLLFNVTTPSYTSIKSTEDYKKRALVSQEIRDGIQNENHFKKIRLVFVILIVMSE